MEDDKMEELKKLAKPMQDWLASNFNPMCEIDIQTESVKIVSTELFVPTSSD